jgi:hypothetical protein
MKNDNNSKWYMVALGILLMPILLCTFIIDRFLMVFLVMSDAPDIVEYFQDMKYIGISLLRTVVVTIVTLIVMWIW